MNKGVIDLEGFEVYQGDLIIYGSDKLDHRQRLIVVLICLIEKNIMVNSNKCSAQK